MDLFRKKLLLLRPKHDRAHLPVPRPGLQVVSELRSKMKLAEDLVQKLSFSIREIQRAPRRRKEKAAPVVSLVRRLTVVRS